MTRRLCFTVDADRDVNECVPGRREAVSLGTGGVRFSSAEAGTKILLDMLDDIGIKATFFAEATALRNINAAFGNNEVAMHGLDHEDMTGEVSGIRLSDEELDEIMRVSSDTVKDITGQRPKGFRAPYMRTDDRIMDAAKRAGAVYDSSVYGQTDRIFRPYDLGNGLKEIPVPAGTDRNGKRITAYLWPMHEGARAPDEFIGMANTMEDGVFVIATHSWHIVESRSSGLMSGPRIKENIGSVRKIITSLLDSGFKAVRMIDAV
jgi:peptidoglycan/xylan/chitin deacetylase (PgdA/CDA1 family)